MRPYKEEPYEFKSRYFRPAYLRDITEGQAEGIVEGIVEGELAAQRGMLKRLLRRRDALTARAESLIDTATKEGLERWIDEVADGVIPRELGRD